MKNLVLGLLILLPMFCFASEQFGKVYFGENLAKSYSEHTDSLKIQINDSDKYLFNAKYSDSVVSNLNLNETHIVKVFFDGVLVQSWKLNFKKLKTNSVVIWRSAGSWRMEPAENKQ